ncbi:hypothetical protein ACKLNR_007293 [Fusarium oxysporum f. sp. zingiberi]
MSREPLGPIVGTDVYPDAEWEKAIELVDTTSRNDLACVAFLLWIPMHYGKPRRSSSMLRACLYINTRCTGSVVAQQPFSGSRDFITNDKTCTVAHLQCFTSVRSIEKERNPLDII